jgi:polysaccharide biosynthesis protein PslG
MANQKIRGVRRIAVALVGALLVHALPALAVSTVSLDGMRDSSEQAYTALPSFAVSRANTGVAIHDIDNTQLLDAAADIGFSFVRADLFWEAVQGADGWHFSTFDSLLAHLSQRGMGALFILGYKHNLYSPNQPPTTPAQLAAFHQYVYQSALHYKNAPVKFEVWNEEDDKTYWLADPSPSAYRRLLSTAVSAAKQANPKVVIGTGGVQQINRTFIRAVGDISSTGQPGPDAVSVHPYRQEYPETVFDDYAALRADLSTYRKVPQVWATEWSYPTYGYKYVSAIDDGHSPKARALQARYVVRRFLTDWISQIGLSSYYDIRNDGANPRSMEDNFGLLDSDNTKLPVYNATKHLFSFTANTTGARYFIDTKNNYVILKLTTANATKYVVWCFGDGNTLNLDTSGLPKNATVTDMYGTVLTTFGGLSVPEEAGPVFISVPL